MIQQSLYPKRQRSLKAQELCDQANMESCFATLRKPGPIGACPQCCPFHAERLQRYCTRKLVDEIWAALRAAA